MAFCMKKMMKQCAQVHIRDVVALILPVLALLVIPCMFLAEKSVTPDTAGNLTHYLQNVLPAMKHYALLFAAALLLTGVSLLLLGQENEIYTRDKKSK